MTVWTYLGDITRVFFRWWWAAITGIASLLPFVGIPGPDISISNVGASVAIFLICSLFFIALSVTVQGYKWYAGAQTSPVVESCKPARSSSEQEVFTVRSLIPLEPGQVITVLRTTDRRTACLGMIKVERVLQALQYQCSPLWISPVHKNDLARGKVHVSQLSTTFLLNETDLVTFANEVQQS